MYQNHLVGLLKQGILGPGLLYNFQGSVQSKNVGPLVEKLNQAQGPSKCVCGTPWDYTSHTSRTLALDEITCRGPDWLALR